MESEGSLLFLQMPATCPYPEPDQSNPCPHIPLPEDILRYNVTKFVKRSNKQRPPTYILTSVNHDINVLKIG